MPIESSPDSGVELGIASESHGITSFYVGIPGFSFWNFPNAGPYGIQVSVRRKVPGFICSDGFCKGPWASLRNFQIDKDQSLHSGRVGSVGSRDPYVLCLGLPFQRETQRNICSPNLPK